MVNHKFTNTKFDAELNGFETNEYAILKKAPYPFEVLVIGTFNAETTKTGNDAHFFYGRKDNNFWYAMRNIFNQEHLPGQNKTQTSLEIIKDICVKLKLTFADLILYVNEPLDTHSDNELLKKVSAWNTDNIKRFITENKSIQFIYFTGSYKGQWKTQLDNIKQAVNGKISFQKIFSPSAGAKVPKGTQDKLDYVVKSWQKEMQDLIAKHPPKSNQPN